VEELCHDDVITVVDSDVVDILPAIHALTGMILLLRIKTHIFKFSIIFIFFDFFISRVIASQVSLFSFLRAFRFVFR